MKITPIALTFVAAFTASSVVPSAAAAGYEVWASDQSNTAPGQSSLGVRGGYIWIYDSDDIAAYLNSGIEAPPLPCAGSGVVGPCNTLDVFPQDLEQMGSNGFTGKKLADLEGFGRLHGVIKDPTNRYVNANFFAPTGGYIGIMDTLTKEAIGLFRVTKFSYNGGSAVTRGVHMSFWTATGDAIIVGNLQGKAVERINVERDAHGIITGLSFDRSASLHLGKDVKVAEEATFFSGSNSIGNPLLGAIVGDYMNADLGDFTPNGYCKESGCIDPPAGAMSLGGRPNTLPICPIVSKDSVIYITLAGGGLIVADPFQTPMKIVGEYEANKIFGAGCAGIPAQDKVFLTGGVSASGAGADQSMFAVFALKDEDFLGGHVNPPNVPEPDVVFRDEGNTLSNGNLQGNIAQDLSGQIPGITTRRDSHGAAADLAEGYVHIVDRIQNKVEVFDVQTYQRRTYDLTSKTGNTGFMGQAGPCAVASVDDDNNLPINDAAPDLLELTPDGQYLMIAFRGPAPVSVPHGAQGSCPGVGIVELGANGKDGKLIGVIRTTNTITDNVSIGENSFPGGVAYAGSERSDVHGCIVIAK